MARGAATRNKRAKPDARQGQQRPRSNVRRVDDQDLFFPRLRKQAKWVFLFLAIIFAGGFVFFGVGSGSTGIGDVFQGNTNGTTYLLIILGVLAIGGAALVFWLISQPGNRSVKFTFAVILAASGLALIGAAAAHNSGKVSAIEKLQKTVAKHPDDAAAWKSLAQALQAKGQTDEAVTAFEEYTALRPKDSVGWQQLASLYLVQAQNYYTQLVDLQARLSAVPGAGLGLPGDSFLVKELQNNPLYAEIVDDLNKQLGELQTKLTGTLNQRAGAWGRAAKTLPADDPSLPGIVFQWARSAEDAQDYKTALQAYQRYLKLVPQGGLSADARAAIKRLKKILGAQPSGSAGATG